MPLFLWKRALPIPDLALICDRPKYTISLSASVRWATVSDHDGFAGTLHLSICNRHAALTSIVIFKSMTYLIARDDTPKDVPNATLPHTC
jgi:hypothetical protein